MINRFVKIRTLKDRIFRVLRQNIFAIRIAISSIGKKFFFPIIFGFIGISFQIIAIAILFNFLKTNKLPVKLDFYLEQIGLSLNQLSYENTALFCSISIFLLFFISAIANFLYQKLTIKNSGLVEKEVIRKLISLIENRALFVLPTITGITNKSMLSRVLFADTRALNRVLQLILATAIPIITMLVSVGAILYLNWQISVLLIPVGFLYSIFVFKINKLAIQGNHEYDKVNARVKKGITDFLYKGKPDVVTSSDPVFEPYFSAYYELVIISHRSAFANDLVAAILLSTVFFGATYSIENFDKTFLAEMTLYLIALRYSVVCLKQFTAKMSVINRFYPQLVRLEKFLSTQDPKIKPYIDKSSTLVFDNIVLKRGEPFFAINSNPIDRFNALSIINSLTKNKDLPNFRRVGMLTRDLVIDTNKKTLESIKTRFLEHLKDPLVNWIIIDLDYIHLYNFSLEEIISLNSNVFTILTKKINEEDLKRKYKVAVFEENRLLEVRYVNENDLLTIEGSSKSSETENDDYLDLEDF